MDEVLNIKLSEYKELIKQSTILDLVKRILNQTKYVSIDDVKTIVGITNVDTEVKEE